MAAMLLSAQPVKLVMPCRCAFFSHFLLIKIARHFQHSTALREGFPLDKQLLETPGTTSAGLLPCFNSVQTLPAWGSSRSSLRPNPCHSSVNHIPHPSDVADCHFFFLFRGLVLRALQVLANCRFSCNIRVHPHYALNHLTSSAPPPSMRMAPSPPVLLPAYAHKHPQC
ncbi:hypothetical protein CPAR01_01002 [Colletotrichum paranaense]|uniref:Secreted protein n=1 Tax=Colletotrichum paranaense TaxID=1914294 RepID=A0ABQ9T5H8_9PEZI|nr:uncharacterized protein CPAR01_01002 [Colletotrichum paranaense]KAK1547035.1 hypothetical protein CPAR01_01002 [Colletotrichum paranaense]